MQWRGRAQLQGRKMRGGRVAFVGSQIEARITGGQTVRGILETMLLNNISQLFATNRVVAVDFDKGVAVVEGTNGQVKAFSFDVATLVIKT